MGGTSTGGLPKRSFPPGEAYVEGAGLYLKSDGKLYIAASAAKPAIFIARQAAVAADVTAAKPLDCEMIVESSLVCCGGTTTIGQWQKTDSAGKWIDMTTDTSWSGGIALETATTGQLFELACIAQIIEDTSDAIGD